MGDENGLLPDYRSFSTILNNQPSNIPKMATIKGKGAKIAYVKSDEVRALENLCDNYRKKRNPDAKKKYYSDRTASELEKCIINYCHLFGVFAEKVQSMGRTIFKGEPIYVRNSNTTGQADLSLIINGKAVKVEVKCRFTKDRYQNDAQKRYQKNVERAGGIYIIIRDFAEFKQWLDNFLKNK